MGRYIKWLLFTCGTSLLASYAVTKQNIFFKLDEIFITPVNVLKETLTASIIEAH